MKSDNCFLCLVMTLTPLFQYIDLLNTVLWPAGSTPGNGLDHRLRQDVYSKF